VGFRVNSGPCGVQPHRRGRLGGASDPACEADTTCRSRHPACEADTTCRSRHPASVLFSCPTNILPRRGAPVNPSAREF